MYKFECSEISKSCSNFQRKYVEISHFPENPEQQRWTAGNPRQSELVMKWTANVTLELKESLVRLKGHIMQQPL